MHVGTRDRRDPIAAPATFWQESDLAFADLKNDYIFWRIFAKHPDLFRRLLNDLLERRDVQTFEQIEYLSDKQCPVAEGVQLSVLNARCTDRAGTTLVVKIQLIHHSGYIKPFVYKVCEPYADQLKEGDCDTKLIDVVAITLCEFELWPDKERDRKGLPRVPVLCCLLHDAVAGMTDYVPDRSSDSDIDQRRTLQLLQLAPLFLEQAALVMRAIVDAWIARVGRCG